MYIEGVLVKKNLASPSLFAVTWGRGYLLPKYSLYIQSEGVLGKICGCIKPMGQSRGAGVTLYPGTVYVHMEGVLVKIPGCKWAHMAHVPSRGAQGL